MNVNVNAAVGECVCVCRCTPVPVRHVADPGTHVKKYFSNSSESHLLTFEAAVAKILALTAGLVAPSAKN